MRIFKQGNWGKNVCPICKTNKKGKVVLVPIEGTFCHRKYDFRTERR